METQRTISASTQTRIMIWRSEVASAIDDAASSAASYAGNASSLSSDTHSSAEFSLSQTRSGGTMARGRRFWHRLARRLSGGRFGAVDDHLYHQPGPATRTAMYRTPLPPVDARAVCVVAEQQHLLDLPDESSDAGRGGLAEKQQRLQRAARLLGQQRRGQRTAAA